MFLSRENDIKPCQNYTCKTYIYMRFCLRFVVLNRWYSTNTRPIWKWLYPNFYLAILMDIIHNIITYSLYSPYFVTITFTNGSAVSLSRVSVCITWPVYWDSQVSAYTPNHFSFTVPLKFDIYVKELSLWHKLNFSNS